MAESHAEPNGVRLRETSERRERTASHADERSESANSANAERKRGVSHAAGGRGRSERRERAVSHADERSESANSANAERKRGVSDVVGFVLVFAIIVATVGVVYTTGLSGLQGARNAERVSNAEKAFDVLQANGMDVVHRGAPSRATEIKLAGARIGPGDPVTVNVTGSGGSGVSRTLRPVVYAAGDSNTRLVYVDGAVVRDDGGHAVMRSPPAFLLGSGSRALVPVVTTYFPNERSVGGRTRVRVRTSVPGPSYRTSTTLSGPVTLNVTSPRHEAWKRYLRGTRDVTACETNGSTVSCTIDRPVVVPTTAVAVRIEG